MSTITLNWYRSESADAQHPDEECGLDHLNLTEPAVWAYVADEGGYWAWNVLDQWLWDDADVLAGGREATKEEAQAAVERWVREHAN